MYSLISVSYRIQTF